MLAPHLGAEVGCALAQRSKLVLLGPLLALLFVIGGRGEAAVVASESFDYGYGSFKETSGGIGWAPGGWRAPSADLCYVCDDPSPYVLRSGATLGQGRVAGFHGDKTRMAPLRRQLAKPFTGQSLYIRFVLRYDARSLDDVASDGDGEFFVMWLDDIDSGDGAGHTANAPSIGVRIPDLTDENAKPGNRFMARISRNHPAYSKQELDGDQTYLIVARLSKSRPDPLADYNRLELWINPDKSEVMPEPDAITEGRTVNSVRWIGFGIGQKTEPQDFITVDEIVLGERWSDVAPGEYKPLTKSAVPGHNDAGDIDFRNQVYPILRDNCFACHQGRDALSGYRLDLQEELLGHLQGKPLATPGDPGQSPIYQVLVTDDQDSRMPPEGEPLSAEQSEIIRTWIEQGLSWDEELLPSEAENSSHWAFQPIERPDVPQTRDGRVQNPIDAFIRAAQDARGVVPAPQADRHSLIRRITLDLTGLPPTPEDVDAFLADQSPGAVRRLVDRLLQSPAYGERWARHWLDVARWAESDGYQHNQKRPTAWRYRDYVIQSFLQNKPFDRFLTEQIAGDELTPYSDENLTATGFLAATRYSSNERDEAIQRNDILVDITNNTAAAFLGLTMECAQCHSHKFDPITARDYYRFMGFFVKGQPVEVLLREGRQQAWTRQQGEVLRGVAEQYDMMAASDARLEAKLRRQGLPTAVTSVEKAIRGIPKQDRQRFDAINKTVNQFDRAWSFYSPVTSPHAIPAPYFVRTSPLSYSLHKLQRAKPVLLVRGDINSPGPGVDVGWPAVFGKVPDDSIVEDRPRTALAEWLTTRSNPLTARVWVNRIWTQHFGRGIVETVDDFGSQGAEPSHPKLLDWLASELLESGWDTGHVQRLILTSAVYQQDSDSIASNEEIDPENALYWRWNQRRLEAEAIRDSLLSVAGLLDTKVGGPSVPVKLRGESHRRTLYLEQKRDAMPVVQTLFDAPAGMSCTGERRTSTVALQPLYLLNDHRAFGYAQAFANRVTNETDGGATEQIEHAFRLALGRPPSSTEKTRAIEFLEESSTATPSKGNQSKPMPGLIDLCHALMNLNEFVYIP